MLEFTVFPQIFTITPGTEHNTPHSAFVPRVCDEIGPRSEDMQSCHSMNDICHLLTSRLAALPPPLFY